MFEIFAKVVYSFLEFVKMFFFIFIFHTRHEIPHAISEFMSSLFFTTRLLKYILLRNNKKKFMYYYNFYSS